VLIENAVPLAEVARVMKRPLAQLKSDTAELQMFVGEDWAGREALSQADAAGLVSGAARRERDERAAWLDHVRRTEQWETDREQTRRDAAQAAYRVAVAHGAGDPAAAVAARDAGVQAAEEFEQSHPAPELNGAPTARNLFDGAMQKIRSVLS